MYLVFNNLSMNKTIATIAALFFFTGYITAQPDVDSLKKIIRHENNVPKKTDLLLQLCERYRVTNPDSGVVIAREAIHLSQQMHDSARISRAEWYIASYYYVTGHPDSALVIAEANIEWLKNKPSLQPLLGQFYSSSGLCCMKLDRKKEALDRFYIALETGEKCNDLLTQLKALVNIGWAMMELNQYKEAIGNFHRAIAFRQEKNMPEMNL